MNDIQKTAGKEIAGNNSCEILGQLKIHTHLSVNAKMLNLILNIPYIYPQLL